MCYISTVKAETTFEVDYMLGVNKQMIRKTAKEIVEMVAGGIGTVISDEVSIWLSTASAKELQEYIRLLGIEHSKWSAFGRDALNVLLANENIKLQKDIRDLTGRLHKLTIVLAIIGLITLYPIINSFFNPTKIECKFNQSTNANQMQDSKNDTLNKTKTINHKETPNK